MARRVLLSIFFFFFKSGKWVIATGVEGIAAQDSVDAESQGFEDVVFFKSLQGIAAATGCETAGGHHKW